MGGRGCKKNGRGVKTEEIFSSKNFLLQNENFPLRELIRFLSSSSAVLSNSLPSPLSDSTFNIQNI